MKTIKLRIANQPDITNDIRLYNSALRTAFNRVHEHFSTKAVRKELHSKFACNSWILDSAIKEANALLLRHNGTRKPVLFGGKLNLRRYLTGIISKEEFRKNRLSPMSIYGERRVHGNRLFNFDLSNHLITYKPSKDRHIPIQFHPVNRNLTNELNEIQHLAKYNISPITIRLSNETISLTYDECAISQPTYTGLKPNRILGIDLNPNYIGLSICDLSDDYSQIDVLHKQVFDLSKLTVASGHASSDRRSKYLTNKLHHETIEIAHIIDRLVNTWKCSKVAMEELNIQQASKHKSRHINRLCHTKWLRTLFIDKISMLSRIHHYDIILVNPAYSSLIGNFVYGNTTTPDMIAASIEIARRAHTKYKSGYFYPPFRRETLDEQWKQTLGGAKTWKEVFLQIKNLGLKYRILLFKCLENAVFSKSYIKRRWSTYVFTPEIYGLYFKHVVNHATEPI